MYIHICTYVYNMVPPRYLPFNYFYWYLRGLVTDLHGWSLAVVSRGGTHTHTYIYIYIGTPPKNEPKIIFHWYLQCFDNILALINN